jgi:hypothetical protein
VAVAIKFDVRPGNRKGILVYMERARVSWRRGASLLLLLAVFATHATRPAAQAPAAESVCDIRTPERVVAIGDVHGGYTQFVTILRAAGLIDGRERWVGGRALLVQTGDVLDRGSDSRKAVDLLRRLERDAANAGGRVHALLGNHEFMRLVGDWRYVSAGELKAFETPDSEDLRQRAHDVFAAQAERLAREEKRTFDARAYRTQFMKEIPRGFLEMRLAFEKDGVYGSWVRKRNTVIKVNGVLFLHGGISDRVAALGCEGVNTAVARDLAALPVPAEQVAALFPSTEDGPLWYRGMASEPEATFAPVLDSVLQRMDARAVVIGHTPVLTGRIQTRFDGRVVLIDTGMLDGEFFPGGVPSALEMRGDSVTAIYGTRREPIDMAAARRTANTSR